MGSFNETCALSNLNVGPGTPVRLLFLTQNPYVADDQREARRGCYHYDWWFVRAPPLAGRYDDYGRAELDPSPLVELVARGFDADVVERERGPNEYHDPAVRKGRPIEHYTEAAWEGRLLVERDGGGVHGRRLPTLVVTAREDVWRAYCDVPVDGRPAVTVGEFERRLRRAWADAWPAAATGILTPDFALAHAVRTVLMSGVPFTTDPTRHLVAARNDKAFTAVDELVRVTAELARVEYVMALLHQPWYVPPLGGQEGRWDLHAAVRSAVL